MRLIDHDLFNSINKLFNNQLPTGTQSLKIEMELDTPTVITVKYIDLRSPNTDPIETKFGLIEYPKESKLYDN